VSAVFADGLGMPETPVRLPDGSWLVVEMSAERGCLTLLSPDGEIRRTICRTGRPNGLRFDGESIWVAETGAPASLLRVTLGGVASVWVSSADGRPFLFPNDLWFGPEGELYMTDSGIDPDIWAATPSARCRELNFDGRVYSIDLATREARILDDGLRFANGLVVDPAGTGLFVNETITGAIYRYDLGSENIVSSRQLFANVLAPEGRSELRGPDGMAFGADGNLYVAMLGQGDVTMVAPDGTIAGRLPTHGRDPTNVAFGGQGERRLYVTEIEFGRIEVLEVATEAPRTRWSDSG
jgi:gluconolactonase